MGVAVAGPARTGPYFAAPTAPTLTAEALARVGLSAQPFAALTIDVVRTSPKGKWHVPGEGLNRCQHLTRAYGYHATARALPVQPVSVLGDYDFCRWCAHRVTPPGPVAVLYAAARWIVAASAWVADLETRAPGMDWLDVARWSARTPFEPDPVTDLLAGLAGARGWARHRLAAHGVWTTLRERADAAFATGRQAAGPPGLRALAARARDLLSADAGTRCEAHLIEAIGGVDRRDIWRPDLFAQALDAWLSALAADGDARTGHTAMSAAVEARYGNAPVRDVSLLPDPALTPPDGHTSPAGWAAAEYTAVHRRLVAGWCTRLNTLLHEAPDRDAHRLLLVAGWPITSSRDREVAYLTRYPVLDRAVAADPDPAQVRELLRRAAGFLSADTSLDPDALPQVAGWRAETGRPTDLRGWIVDGGHGWNLPARWRWIPDRADGRAAGAEDVTDVAVRGAEHRLAELAGLEHAGAVVDPAVGVG